MVKSRDALDLDKALWSHLTKKQVEFLFDLMARHSRWVLPEVWRRVPVVYPKTRRYKRRAETRGQLINGCRVWSNEPAKEAFWMALGSTPSHFKGYAVCHIYDEGVWLPKHYTNLANLTAVPRSIASFTDQGPINILLRYRSFKVYGYTGPNKRRPEKPRYYPDRWLGDGGVTPNAIESVVARLRKQRDTRPGYRR